MTSRRTVSVVTGTRAEFGLLVPVMRAIETHAALDLEVLVTGTHLLPPARTIDEVAARFPVAATIPMQEPGQVGRDADAIATGRGVTGFAARFAAHRPGVVLVLGDRIEAFAAAAAAAIAGIHVAHLHGGDRAEGVADESMRHAITKLAHVHLPATPASLHRIIAMGEEASRAHLVGSPAIDGLDGMTALDPDAYAALGHPEIVMLLHPTGADPGTERARATGLIARCREAGRVLALHPNHDAGREGILAAIEAAPGLAHRPHLDRPTFVGLLRRARVLVGNSSAGLIECAALGRAAVDIGRRQAGREHAGNVIRCPDWEPDAVAAAIASALAAPPFTGPHPYGDGHCGERVAAVLAAAHSDNHPIVKRCTY